MICSFDTSNFLVTMEDGVYTANKQNGIHTHPDGNTSHKLLADYPSKIVTGQFYSRSEVADICAVQTDTVVLEMTDGELFLLQFNSQYGDMPFSSNEWQDGGHV